MVYTLFSLISVGYHSELCVATTLYRHIVFANQITSYSVGCILTTYVIWVKNDTFSIKKIIATHNYEWSPTLIRKK